MVMVVVVCLLHSISDYVLCFFVSMRTVGRVCSAVCREIVGLGSAK